MEAKYPRLVSGAKYISHYADGVSSDYVHLAQCIDGDYASEKWEEFSDFATKACNEYAGLVNALQNLVSNPNSEDFQIQALAVLAQVGA
jgi:hypothetical protein